MASSSSVSVFDNNRFKTTFNEELYNSIVKNKKVIAKCCIDLDEDEYPEVKEQIALRGWRRLAAPKQEISIDLIHEFYANAVVTEEEMEEAGRHTFRSFVRGVPVDFSPENIRTVMRFRAQVQGATTDFETRKEHDQQLDRVLADLCMPRATWKLNTGQLRVPIQLGQQELNPVARGWHEFSIYSLIPSSNRYEIPVIRAILIHCIMRGEDVRAEDIIADKIVRMTQGIKEKGKLGFPSTIYKLCKEAGVPLREFRRTRKTQAEKPITARRMESTRLPRPAQRRQQEDEEEDESMPQAEEVNEEENVEQQGDDCDYHHQPDYEQQHPEYEQHQEFNEPPVQQPPLYHVPTYTDQHQKDLASIKEQLQNMMWYQQQALENMSKNQAEYMAELRDIKGKQQELYENNDKFYNELRDWTRNASARETYTVWAHQQANPNLVEMSSQKIVKQIYDNIDHKRPMFKGLLKSDLQPPNPTPPTSSSKDPKDPASSSKDPKNPPK
ncbi:hypothetical protein PIB30_091701 [Stylosanthes scabra]|uniref:Putative plant transposon protein domain-containing protein n=1 Tax=Stylosanthes scabra TaxID=79078 RepID=A0ABU6VT41_9FABA|nr:hypothetical protein [Stylosanthes scabra]